MFSRVRSLGRSVLTSALSVLEEGPRQVHTDGWENAVTGLGTYARDKSMAATFERCESLTLDWQKLEALYHDDDISGRIVDIYPDHMFRKGWDVAVEDDDTGEKAKAFTKYAKRLQINTRCKEAERWGRLKGGALVFLGIDDNRTVDQPVDEANIRTIKYANVIERQYATPNTFVTDPFDPRCGEPDTYLITNTQLGAGMGASLTSPTPTSVGGTYVVHASRVVRFEGAPTSKQERMALNGWTHTVLQRPYEKIKAFVQAFQASSNLMTDASQGVYKLEGLMSQIGSNEKSLLEARMLMLDMGRSVARSILLDKDGEEFERTVTTITGYPEMLDRFMMLLSSATGIPVTLLMGRSAAGMNATGDSDFRQFYDIVESKQVHELEPKLQCIYRLIGLAKDGPIKKTKGKSSKPKVIDDLAGEAPEQEDVDLEFTFLSLWSPTIMEQAQINFTQSQADLNYVTMGATTGEEIGLSRFPGNGRINLGTRINLKDRREAMSSNKTFDPYKEAEHEDVAGEMDLKRQGKAPEPPPVMGHDGKPAPGGAGNAPNNGRAGKVTRANSSQPGYKSGSGR